MNEKRKCKYPRCISYLHEGHEGDYCYLHERPGEISQGKMVRENTSEALTKLTEKEIDRIEDSPNNKLYTISEVAKGLGYSQRSIRDMLKQGWIQGTRVKPRGKWLISGSEINRFKKEGSFTPDKLESLQQGKTVQIVPKELIPKIEKLAEKLQLLISVPEPERPLLTDAQRKGNADFSLTAIRTITNAFWWCTDPSVHVYLDLNLDQEVLFNRFLSLPTSQRFKTFFDGWESKTNRYLDLVRTSGDEEQIKVAYQKAKYFQPKAKHELSEAILALRWPNEILVSTKAN